jgi:hypothetical protein
MPAKAGIQRDQAGKLGARAGGHDETESIKIILTKYWTPQLRHQLLLGQLIEFAEFLSLLTGGVFMTPCS